MNGFDIVLLILACVLIVFGMIKGLIRILIGVAALVAAFILAARFHRPLAEQLTGLVDLTSEPARLIAYGSIFLGVMFAGAVLAWTMRKMVKFAMLGWADRLAGAALGLAAAALASALVILPLVAYSPSSDRILARSKLAPYVTVVADLANRLVPADMSALYRERIEGIRRSWREKWFEEGDDGRVI